MANCEEGVSATLIMNSEGDVTVLHSCLMVTNIKKAPALITMIQASLPPECCLPVTASFTPEGCAVLRSLTNYGLGLELATINKDPSSWSISSVEYSNISLWVILCEAMSGCRYPLSSAGTEAMIASAAERKAKPGGDAEPGSDDEAGKAYKDIFNQLHEEEQALRGGRGGRGRAAGGRASGASRGGGRRVGGRGGGESSEGPNEEGSDEDVKDTA